MTKKLEYIGPHTDGIFLPGDVFVPHGGVVEVDDKLGADLLSREEDGKKHWRKLAASAAPKKPRRRARSAPTAGPETPLPPPDHEVKET